MAFLLSAAQVDDPGEPRGAVATDGLTSFGALSRAKWGRGNRVLF